MKKINKRRGAINPIYSIDKQRQRKGSRNSGKDKEKMGEVLNLSLRNEELGDQDDDSFSRKTATLIDFYALMIVPIGFLLVLCSYFIYLSI